MNDDEERPPDRVSILKTVMIAHAEEPAEREQVPLDLELWREVVETDPALQPVEDVPGRAYDEDGRLLTRLPRPGSALWLSHPGGQRVTFVPKRWGLVLLMQDPEDAEADIDGFVELDESALAKCNAIAASLHAKVFVRELEIPVWDS